MINRTLTLFCIGTMILLAACVPQRKFLDTKEDLNEANQRNANCQEKLGESMKKNDEYHAQLTEYKKLRAELERDTMKMGAEYRRVEKMNKTLRDLYEKVITQNKDLLNTSTAQTQKLEMELMNKKMELEAKEKYLKTLEEDINKQKADLEKMELEIKAREKSINALNNNLAERSARVQELESMINAKDSIVNALKDKIADALTSFNADELTVEMKNGKVYVSLAEQLLFKSGSTAVDTKGKQALTKMAAVLKKNPDINILIEGHTDNVPMKGSTIKDNWDLSVLRATSIVRILNESGMEQGRITAAGRADTTPVASNETKEGRAKNRRTEIILTPKLDELFQLLETN